MCVPTMGRFEEWLRGRITNDDNLVDRALLAATEQEAEDQIQPSSDQQINALEHRASQENLEEHERAEDALRAMLPLALQKHLHLHS